MLQVANTDLFNPLVHKANNCELLFSLQINPVCKSQLKLLRIFISCTLGTNGFIMPI